MRKWITTSLILLTTISFIPIAVFARETLKAGVQYSMPKNQKIELRVTKVPKKLPWLERGDDGKLNTPETDSTIVAQNTKAIEIIDQFGDKRTIPKGTKFYAKVRETTPAKSFWRKGKAKLEFFAIDPSGGKEIYKPDYSISKYNGKDLLQPSPGASHVKLEGELDYHSEGTGIKDTLRNLSSTGAYTLAGAVAAPFVIFGLTKGLGSLVAVSAVSNPYILGGAAAVGASAGLAYGIIKKGRTINLEPGSELEIKLTDPWLIVSALEKSDDTKIKTKPTPQFEMVISEVKKKRDEFGDLCLRISLSYKNHTKEELRYSSFQLVDSMGKEYEPSISSLDKNIFGELPQNGNLNLYFNTDFPKTLHQLRALRIYDQKALAVADVILD